MAKALLKSLAIAISFSFLSSILLFAFLLLLSSSPFRFHDYHRLFSASSAAASAASFLPSISIFASPSRPFLSFSANDTLFNAISSWILLFPSSRIFLLGSDPTFLNASVHLRHNIFVEPHIDHNFRGAPHFHSMLARAHQAHPGISLLVMDATVVFLQGFVEALYKAMQMGRDWVMFARDWEHLDGGVEFWAWNNDPDRDPLLSVSVPPFSHVAGTYEDWVVYHLMRQDRRAVIDATDARITGRRKTAETTAEGPSSKWEWEVNEKLLSEVGNATDQIAIHWRLIHCAEATVHNLCMIQGQKEEERRRRSGGDEQSTAIRRQKEAAAAVARMSHNLDELLPHVADENKVVVMVGGTWNYKEMLMSFVCRVQALGVKSVLVAAFDEAMLEYAYMQGLAVYMEATPEDYGGAAAAAEEAAQQCLFASECFKQVSKLKSRSVLRVLRKGYTVLWSDIDVYWFRNPVAELLSYGEGTLVIQSDEAEEGKAENSIRGANSGFYLARAEEGTVKAMRAIVGHAMASEMTEQPSFYDVLCGEKGEKRVGERECRRSDGGLRTVFLNRERFPNGQVYRHWESLGGAASSCQQKDCVVLHNNYIQGKGNKMKRFVTNGMWFYDPDNRMCLHPWHPLHPSLNFSSFQAHFLSALHLPLP